MAHLLRNTAQRETISAWVSNAIAVLWNGQGTMMPHHLHPLIAERVKRTPSFQIAIPRHLRMYSH